MPGHQGAATVPLHRRDVPSSHGAYKRAHRGDKIVDYGTSLFAPQGYAAIFYLRHRNADGSYASGGVAYYCHTRRVSKPAHDAVYGFDAVARMTAVSHGTGTFTETRTVAFYDGGSSTDTTTITFAWNNAYGTARRPFAIDACRCTFTITTWTRSRAATSAPTTRTCR
jgi:hypothetical protein